ncbi:MAG: GHKL domain-containing protein, partial [Desulfobacteraceae bacterium]|nr:GHKL domain-containing protein [Desulfobacteraceae bacterium]
CTETEIMQVILNIVKNAAQAMTDKGGFVKNNPQIIVRTRDKGTACIIEIIDNGPGLDKKSQDKIFEPFYTTKAPGQGTGIGLSVSYFIITNNHNGSLKVESKPGKGTRFIIELPLEVRKG